MNTILPTPDQLIANPTAFTVTVTPYQNVIEEINQNDKFPSPLGLLKLSDYYVALRDEYNLLTTILNSIRISKKSANFPFDPRVIDIFKGEAGVESIYDGIHFDLSFLEAAIAECYSETRACTVESAIKAASKPYDDLRMAL